MFEISLMSVILTIILLAIGVFGLIGAVNYMIEDSYYASRNKAIIDVVVVLLYLLVCGFTGLMYLYSGFNMNVIYYLLFAVVVVLLGIFVSICVRNWDEMNKIMVVCFLLYFAVVLYLTIFMRIGSVDTSILTTPFDDLKIAIAERDPAMAQHMFLNVLMFVPFGYLIPAMNKERLRGWYFAMLGGLMASTVIEGTQMIFSLGQSDIDDIIANTFGAIVGYLIVRFVWQFQKNWTL